MKVAFLNLCHCEPEIVARVANKLTKNPNFDMYIHVDAKKEIALFQTPLKGNDQVYFISNRQKVYWGGYNAITATMELLKEALKSSRKYEYFVVLQNLDYPIKSNQEIEKFFIQNQGTEFIRGCKIGRTKDWHYARKYKIFNKRDDEFYLMQHNKLRKYMHYAWLALRSVQTIFFNGVIKEGNREFVLHYGTAQWAVTRKCAEYFVKFEATHPKFNKCMQHIQFPDEEYFHTIVHNSEFKYHCVAYDEPVKRWLVNWRNLHYFEYPREVTVFDENDYKKIMDQDCLFCRKVKTKKSEKLMDLIDKATSKESA
ncbi:MAG: beta-1,6-N-acetylglucosaminyltransferase [bacterium]|nr:beta-1,6-N-acetylglucosaminyltransferase [bacterium]